ncbi:hypothetical protein THMIRHAS_04640 [Thiosulfatimonas sediminis]|uniref:DUF560 domain-containing protein n=1 Tax=Thiosulfatimonas sediminis TaxID=2675054 RepID=A0A6F8PSI8_9GAMM|nr:hypothetical protein [Thiosulfatimonas sediminis]BBP45091.1 hypothetical protein THMIRHAS_04640 [Thiosulfatimonas sediminis]
MRQFIYVSILSGLLIGISLTPLKAAGLQDINQLEQRLFSESESAELYLALAQAYAQSGDINSAQAYLQLIEETWPLDTLPKTLQTQLTLLTEQLKLYHPSKPEQHHYMLVLESGYESNANRGTDLDFLTFSLDNGEALYLSLDEQSQKRESFFISATALHHYLPENQDWMISTAVETTQYRNPELDSSLLIRSSLRWQTQSITLYHYENSRRLTGMLYSGNYQPFNWAFRRQNDRQVGSVGVSMPWGQKDTSHSVALNLGIDEPLERRAGGISDNIRFKYQFNQNRLNLSYQFEYGRDRQAYNPFFYADKHDEYHWHSLALGYTLSQSLTHRLGLKLQYDRKKHDIALNSWNNAMLQLNWAKMF